MSTPGPRTLALVGILLTVFVVPLSVAGSSIALPAVSADLGDATTALQWVVNAFNVAFAGATVPWGLLIDRIGRAVVFRSGAVAFLAGGVLSALASNLVVLDIARAVVGVGASGLLVAASATIAGLPTAVRARMFTSFGTIMGLGLATGPTCMGMLVDTVGWRWAFAAPGLLALGGTVLSARFPRHHADSIQPASHGTRSLLSAPFVAVCAVPVLHAVGFIALLTWLPLVLRATWGVSAAGVGAIMLVMTLPTLLASPFGSFLAHRGPRWSTTTVTLIAIGALAGGDALVLFGVDHPPLMLVGMALTGVAFGLPLGLLDGAAIAAAPPGASGLASGTFNLIRLGAEAVAVAAMSAAIAAAVTRSTADAAGARAALAGRPLADSPLPHAFVAVQVVVLAIVVAGGAVLLWLFTRTPRALPAGKPLSMAAAGSMSGHARRVDSQQDPAHFDGSIRGGVDVSE